MNAAATSEQSELRKINLGFGVELTERMNSGQQWKIWKLAKKIYTKQARTIIGGCTDHKNTIRKEFFLKVNGQF